jgi:Type III restriction enzyme, res subunit/Helicase conserved C-terminal domain
MMPGENDSHRLKKTTAKEEDQTVMDKALVISKQEIEDAARVIVETYTNDYVSRDKRPTKKFLEFKSAVEPKLIAKGHSAAIQGEAMRLAWNACEMARFLDHDESPAAVNSTRNSIINNNVKKEEETTVPGARGRFMPHQDLIARVVATNAKLRYGLLYHSTGSGKTCTMMAVMHALFASQNVKRFLFVVPNLTLRENIVASLKSVCGGADGIRIAKRSFPRPEKGAPVAKWSGLEWSYGQGAEPCRAVFVTIKSMNDLSLVPIIVHNHDTNTNNNKNKNNKSSSPPLLWKSRAETCVFIDEAHQLFVNNSISAQLSLALGNEIPQSRELQSKRDSDRTLLFLGGVRMALALTATPIESDPTEVAAYLDVLHHMTAPGAGCSRAIGYHQFEFKDSKGWDALETEWRKHLKETGGFVSYYRSKNDSPNFPAANYSLVPINLSVWDHAEAERLDWRTRSVSVRIMPQTLMAEGGNMTKEAAVEEFRRDVMTLYRAQRSKKSMTATDSPAMLRVSNKYKLPVLYQRALSELHDSPGPVMVYSNAIEAGTDLVAKYFKGRGFSNAMEPPPSSLAAGSTTTSNSNKMSHPLSDFLAWHGKAWQGLKDDVARCEDVDDPGPLFPGLSEAVSQLRAAYHAELSVEQVVQAMKALIVQHLLTSPASPVASGREEKPASPPLASLISMYARVKSSIIKADKGGSTRTPPRSWPSMFFGMITGKETSKSKRQLLLDVFNSVANHDGSIISVMIISAAGGTGIDYKNIKQMHVLDTDWRPSVLIQALGRATRHKSLAHNRAMRSLPRSAAVKMISYSTMLDRESVEAFVGRSPDLAALKTIDEVIHHTLATKYARVVRATTILHGMSIESGFMTRPSDVTEPSNCRARTMTTRSVKRKLEESKSPEERTVARFVRMAADPKKTETNHNHGKLQDTNGTIERTRKRPRSENDTGISDILGPPPRYGRAVMAGLDRPVSLTAERNTSAPLAPPGKTKTKKIGITMFPKKRK